MEPETGIKAWQWMVTVIVIIALVVFGYYIFKGNNVTAPTSTDSIESTESDKNATNRVVISDQFPGNIVYLSSVQLDKPGFVVIKKDNKGVPGDIIGYQYFDKGINPGKVTLTKSTIEGGLYYATLYSDNGDKKFDEIKDLPIKNASGNEIMKTFRATSSITEVKG